VFLRVYKDPGEARSTDFLRRLKQTTPMKIVKVLTDNDNSPFTDRFTHKARQPSGQHPFDRRCTELGIGHRLCPPRHPQWTSATSAFPSGFRDPPKTPKMNAHIERFNQTIREEFVDYEEQQGRTPADLTGN
jgi:hypothetical protein